MFQSSQSEEVGCGVSKIDDIRVIRSFSPLKARKWAAGALVCVKVRRHDLFQSSQSEEVGCGSAEQLSPWTWRGFSPLKARKWAAGQGGGPAHHRGCGFSPLKARKWAAGPVTAAERGSTSSFQSSQSEEVGCGIAARQARISRSVSVLSKRGSGLRVRACALSEEGVAVSVLSKRGSGLRAPRGCGADRTRGFSPLKARKWAAGTVWSPRRATRSVSVLSKRGSGLREQCHMSLYSGGEGVLQRKKMHGSSGSAFHRELSYIFLPVLGRFLAHHALKSYQRDPKASFFTI